MCMKDVCVYGVGVCVELGVGLLRLYGVGVD
jgi:hypothetical protein